MSAYGCCGEYNEHAPDCITVKYDELKAENTKFREKLIRAAKLCQGGLWSWWNLKELLIDHAPIIVSGEVSHDGN